MCSTVTCVEHNDRMNRFYYTRKLVGWVVNDDVLVKYNYRDQQATSSRACSIRHASITSDFDVIYLEFRDAVSSHELFRNWPRNGTDADAVESANTISIVHTNLIAPVIIKNCQEEFQHVSDLQEPVVYGRLSENSVLEHPLIQVPQPLLVFDMGSISAHDM